MKKLSQIASLSMAALCGTVNAQSDLSVDFRLDDGLTMLTYTYTHMGADVNFGRRYIQINGSFFNLTGSPSYQFIGTCEDKNPAVNSLVCTLSIGAYTGIMVLSMESYTGNITTFGTITDETDGSPITLIYTERADK